VEPLVEWINEYVTYRGCDKAKNACRQHRYQTENNTQRVALSEDAHAALKACSQAWDLSLSDTVIKLVQEGPPSGDENPASDLPDLFSEGGE
jgi:hypothetical protein